MKNFKKILAAVLAFTFVLAMAAVGISAGPSETKWYSEAVAYLDSLGISDIGFGGEEELSREEFVYWVAQIDTKLSKSWAAHEYIAETTFSDVSDSEYKGAIGYATTTGFIEGYPDGTFKPAQQITMGEVATILVRLMRYDKQMFDGDWAYAAVQTAQYYFNAFDRTYNANVETSSDPNTLFTKGMGAYVLYGILNGELWADGVIEDDEKEDLRLTSTNKDLGKDFATDGSAIVKQQFVVSNVPLLYTNSVMTTKRYDTYLSGAIYDSLFDDNDLLYNSNGLLDTTGTVTLQNLSNGAVMTMSASDFATLVKTAAGKTSKDTSDALNYIEQGSVVTISTTRANQSNILEDTDNVDVDVFKSFTINDSLVADTYVGYKATTTANIKKGTAVTGWKFATSDSTATNTYARLSSAQLFWTEISYDEDGAIESAKLSVNGELYDIVTSYTGKSGELKVFAPEGILENTTKTVVSTVGFVGDTVYAGGVFSDAQLAILNLHGDYDDYFNGNTVKTTFQLTEDIGSYVSYELDVEAGFVTSTFFILASNFATDGRLDQNYIDATTPLTAADAYQLILSPAQGESDVILSDIDGDGLYDVAVVTESTRALYYGAIDGGDDGLNGKDGSLNPGSYGQYGQPDDFTKEVYDSFGNFILSATGLKGHAVGGLVVDKDITVGGTTSNGTDGWSTNAAKATNKVQLVIVGSNERLPAGFYEQVAYGPRSIFPYKVVDVAELTTAYIENVDTASVTIDGVECWRAEVLVGASAGAPERQVLYIPLEAEDLVDLDVTVDGVKSTVTFASGKTLLSFVTNHIDGSEIGSVQSGAWMAGRTIKFASNEENVAWCVKDAAIVDSLSGYVASVSKNANGGETSYTMEVVSTKTNGSYVNTALASSDLTFDYLKEHVKLVEGTCTVLLAFGLDAWFNDDIDVEYFEFTAEGRLALGTAGFQTLFNLADTTMTGLYYAADTTTDTSYDSSKTYYVFGATDYVEAEGANFDWLFVSGTTYYTFTATSDTSMDSSKTYYVIDNGAVSATQDTAFEKGTTYYEVETVDTTTTTKATKSTTYYLNTSGSYVAATADDFDWEFTAGVQYFEDTSNVGPDGTKVPSLKQTGYVSGINGGVPTGFYTGTIISVTDYERHLKAQYQGLVDISSVVTDANFATLTLYDEDGAVIDATTATYDEDATYYAYYFTRVEDTSGNLFGFFNDQTDLSLLKNIVEYQTIATIGDTVKKVTVSGSNTAVWDYSAETWAQITSILDGKLINPDRTGMSFYEADASDFVTALDSSVTYYTFAETEDTSFDASKDYYELSDEEYAATSDTTMDSSKTYYERTTVATTAEYDSTVTYYVESGSTSVVYVEAGDDDFTLDFSETKTYYTYGDSGYTVVASNAAYDDATTYYFRDTINGLDLVYVTLTKATDYNGTHYTLNGIDWSAYETVEDGYTTNYIYADLPDSSAASRTIMRGTMIQNDVTRTSWRADTYMGLYTPRFTTGPAVKDAWTEGGETSIVGSFNNEYILGYAKVADSTEPVPDDNGFNKGFYDLYNLIIGYNPYYVRNSNGTATLMFEKVESLSGVKGYNYYDIDTSKVTLLELYEGDTVTPRHYDATLFSDTSSYYHKYDENVGYERVWKIEPLNENVSPYSSDLVYSEPQYDTTDAAVATVSYDIAASSVKSTFGLDNDVTEASLVTITAVADAVIPAYYNVTIKTNLNETATFGMTKNFYIVVLTPVGSSAATANFSVKVLTPADLVANGQSIFAAAYQYTGTSATCTNLSIIGKVLDKPTTPTNPTTPVTPVDPTPSTKTPNITNTITSATNKTARLVYLNASAGAVSEIVFDDEQWVIRSSGSAIDVVTLQETGLIKLTFHTLTEWTNIANIDNATAHTLGETIFGKGGYFLVDENNIVIANVTETVNKQTTSATYGSTNAGGTVTVYTGVITSVNADGKTIATIAYNDNGTITYESFDVSNLKFHYMYHDIDGNNFGLGKANRTSVSVKSTADILALYSTYEAIVNEGVGGANMYDADDIADAAEQIEAIKATIVSSYLNGTFWNIANSPAYKFLNIQQIGMGTAGLLYFNYVVIGGEYYVFVNSFN